MDDILPSYELATARDVWAIAAHYIPSADLCAASLVSKRWHERFVPFLWGAPASHFGTDNDAVYVALTRFRRTLKRARLWVRLLTHTLHLPPALSEIYGGPRSSWLQEVLEYLPNLQSLLVSRLPFFDHNSLITLGQGRRPGAPARTYALRLLLANHEPNTTSAGLAETLKYIPQLVYLDLSYTTPARDHAVLSGISHLRHLQVLKLRGLGLRDSDIETLSNAIGTRVRLLDVANNMLTDESIRYLLQNCFFPRQLAANRSNNRLYYEWSSSLDPRSNILNADSLQSEHLDDHLLRQLTTPLTGRSALEDLPHQGITHLYIADNHLSVEGLASLLGSSRLHVFDGGTVDTAESINRRQRSSAKDDAHWIRTVRFPGAEKLIPVLANSAAKNLTFLRAHHALVTEEAPTQDNLPLATLLLELPTEGVQPGPHHYGAELESSENQVHELPADVEPRFELADTSPAQRSEDENLSSHPSPDAGDDGAPIMDARGTGQSSTRPPESGDMPPSSCELAENQGSSLPEVVPPSPTPSQIRNTQIQELLAKRPKNQLLPQIGPDTLNFPFLHPSHLPHLRTLVLTDVPSSVPASSQAVSSLIRFITACSHEAQLAYLQARSNYSLPPGPSRILAEHQHAKSLFALERIILEITPVAKGREHKGLASWKPHNQSHSAVGKSSTEDVDSENLWSAAANDFSFFGEDECGIPEDEPEKHFPMAALNEKVSLTPDDSDSMHSPTVSELDAPLNPVPLRTGARSGLLHTSRPPSMSQPQGPIPRSVSPLNPSSPAKAQPASATTEEPDIDVVAALAAFRRSKKAEFDELVYRERIRLSTDAFPATSPTPPYVEGYWKGEVKIVRNPIPKVRSGVVDIYGNYFEKGYLYP